ncbi:hypothetical protein F5Y12DRAFT_780202, partial [Xylaria sp. FL1777]
MTERKHIVALIIIPNIDCGLAGTLDPDSMFLPMKILLFPCLSYPLVYTSKCLHYVHVNAAHVTQGTLWCEVYYIG